MRLLLIARASHREVETQLLIAKALSYAPVKESDRLALNDEVGRMLAGLLRALANRP